LENKKESLRTYTLLIDTTYLIAATSKKITLVSVILTILSSGVVTFLFCTSSERTARLVNYTRNLRDLIH